MSKPALEHKKLKAIIKHLAGVRGRHTELVTVYVPAGYNLIKVAEQIRNEQGTASNIKSKNVRKNVMSALEKITQHLKLYRETPPNGLAIFSGNISESEGESDVEMWAIEPPEPLQQRLYRCDQQFVLEPLEYMIREREIYGLIVLDKSESDIGLLKGKRVESLKHIESLVPGKTKKGGWSQARYARVREGLLHDHLKKTGEIANAKFREIPELKGIIIGGPGPIKDNFYKGDFLGTDVKNKVMGVVDTSYTGSYGLEETVTRSEDILAEASVTREKKMLNTFFAELSKDSGMAVYGIKEVVKALEAGAIETLLISESFDWTKATFRCSSCGKEVTRILKKDHDEEVTCPYCSAGVLKRES